MTPANQLRKTADAKTNETQTKNRRETGKGGLMTSKHYKPAQERTRPVGLRIHTWAWDVAQTVARRQDTTPSGVLTTWIDELAHREQRREAQRVRQ